MESPFALGMGVMIAMQIFGRISGGHVNPMISITSVLIGQLSVIDALCYIVAQFTGAFAAQIMLLLLLPNLYVYGTPNPRDGDYKFCSPRISAEMSGGKALGLEGVITFLLTMSFCGMWDLRNEKWIDSRPLRLGVIISGLTIAAWPFTGGFLNPARTLAAAAVNNFWEYCHMYLIGQLLGGVLGALTYIIFFIQLEPSQDVTAPPAEEEKA
ncbi:hypothetical protein Zmor_014127 [Zophobas morio]|uniref:Uncharacterized protein n=2 Tax=Zophobas morio TaxID=2755281 RepID=A0AA38IGR8_9CUCU|nr:hypothetical protein Zmor_014127 [Zophobas morio]